MKKIIFIVIVTLIWAPLSGQSNPLFDVPNQVATISSSPQTQLFEKYLNHEITEYNGLPHINIPLYTIEVDGITIPISLTYHASGIKYDQYDGDVGVGWTINAGGYRVSRTIHGRLDERFDFYNQTTFEESMIAGKARNDSYLASIFSEDNTLIKSRYPLKDSQYDIFNYVMPSTQGAFFITNRNTNSIATFDDNNDKINLVISKSPSSNSSASNFIDIINIIDDAGNIYTCKSKEQAFDEFNGPNTFTTWALDKILTNKNKEILFSYEYISEIKPQYPTIYTINSAVWGRNYDGVATRGRDETLYSEEIPLAKGVVYPNVLYVSEIKTDNANIYFKRNNISGTYNRLISQIEVRDKLENIIKQINFEYSLPNQTSPHIHLVAVTEGKLNILEKKYSFEYYNPHLRKESLYPNIWGYYCSGGSTSVPFIDKELFSTYKIIESVYWGDLCRAPRNPKCTYKYPSHNYRPIFGNRLGYDLLDAYSLRSITYPTGGKTEFVYEANQYTASGRVYKGAGQRIREIISKQGEVPVKHTEYRYGEDEQGNGVPNIALENKHFYTESMHFSRMRDELNPFCITWETVGVDGNKTFFDFCQLIHNYHTNPIISEMSNVIVRYNEVSKYEFDAQSKTYNGKIVSNYSIPHIYALNEIVSTPLFNDDIWLLSPNNYWNFPYISFYQLGHKPILSKRLFYNKDYKCLKEEIYSYKKQTTKSFLGLKAYQRFHFSDYQEFKSIPPNPYTTWLENSLFEHAKYYLITGRNDLLELKKTIDYTDAGTITSKEEYTYNNNNLLKTKKTFLDYLFESGTSNVLEEEYKYPNEYNSLEGLGIYQRMYSQMNMKSSVIEVITKNNDKEVSRLKTNYSSFGGIILPSSLESVYNNKRTTEYTYDLYDKKGNILQMTGKDLLPISYIWGYNYLYPIAEIKNMTYANIEKVLGTDFLKRVNSESTPLPADLLKINSLRQNVIFYDTLITTYTYRSPVGLISNTNPQGITTYYEYDMFNHLKEIYIKGEDGKKKILESYFYNYHYK